MKIIYNNKILNLNLPKNCSIFHLLIACLKEINENPENCENFYITNFEGVPQKNSNVVNSNNKYYLKQKLNGGNLFNFENLSIIVIFGSILVSILSVKYYDTYLKTILIQVPPEIRTQIEEYAITTSSKKMDLSELEMEGNNPEEGTEMENLEHNKEEKPNKKSKDNSNNQNENNNNENNLREYRKEKQVRENAPPRRGRNPGNPGKPGNGEYRPYAFEMMETKPVEVYGQTPWPNRGGTIKENIESGTKKVGNFFTKAIDFLMEKLQDSQTNIYVCTFLGQVPNFVIKKNTGGFLSIISAALFTSFILFVGIPFVTNISTHFQCKNPNVKSIIISFVFLILPFIISLFVPKLIDMIKDLSVLKNYKLSICNIFLAIIFGIYMILNRKGISAKMYFILPICLGFFTLLNLNFRIGNRVVGISTLFADISAFISNFITNAEPVTDPNYLPPKSKVNLQCNKKVNLNGYNVAECFHRFNFIFDFLKIIIIFFISLFWFTITFHSQVNKACGS